MKKHTMNRKNEIIRLDDRLVYHGSYNLSARATKVICYVLARYIDSRSSALPEVVSVPVADLCGALADGRGGKASKSFYNDAERLCDELTENRIVFRSDVKVDGTDIKGYMNWCSAAMLETRDGVKYIDFHFCKYLGQFLFGLSKYVRLYRPELNRLRTGYAIRLFQMLKGERNRKEKFGGKSVYVFEIERLRFLLGLKDEYGAYKSFRRRIIQPSIKQINEKTTVRVLDVVEMRRQGGRKVTHLEFHFVSQSPEEYVGYVPEGKNLPDFVPEAGDLNKLSRSEVRAYGLLVDFGVRPGIAYRKILPEIKGSESYGFEDYFIRHALAWFEEKARNKKSRAQAAATFVTWWTQHRIFDVTGDAWIRINERVVGDRKKLERKNPVSFENRLVARTMTDGEFTDWYRGGDNTVNV